MPSTFTISPDFRKLWIGQTISHFGSWLGALGLLAILHLAATPAQMGLLETLRAAPVLLIGLFAGVWVDRLRRRPLLLAADLLRAALLAVVVLAALGGWLRMMHLYVVGFLAGGLTVLFNIAYRSYVPGLVSRTRLVEANSKLGATESLAEIASPGLGGLLVQVIGAPLTVAIDAFSFLLSALFIGRIRTAEQSGDELADEGEAAATVWREIREGLQLVWRNPTLRALTGSAAVRSFFGGFYAALYALYGIQDVGLNPATLGLIIGAGGIGGLGGTLLVNRAMLRFGVGRALMGALLIQSTIGLLTPLAAGRPLAVAIAFMLIPQLFGDLFGAIYFIISGSLLQTSAPDRVLGRVNASFEFITGGIGALGIFGGGLLGSAIGMSGALLVAVLGIMSSTLWIYFSPIREMKKVEE
ncbi:MAG: MFS transporter [Caldilineaceae bacterium]